MDEPSARAAVDPTARATGPGFVDIESTKPGRERRRNGAPRHAVPEVSAVIATYDRADYLGDAIESVLAQRDVHLECIVVDDGSEDDTPELLGAYGDRIRFLRILNGGPSRARNIGARLAHAPWLAFLDSDDRWAPDKLARQLEVALARHSEFVYTDRRGFGDVVPGRELLSTIVRMRDGDVFEALLEENFIALSSVLIRRDAFLRLGGFCETLEGSEDWDLWLRYAAERPVALLREPLMHYRKHDQNISRDPHRMAGTHVRVIERALGLPRATMLPPHVCRAARARAYDATAEHAIHFGRLSALQWHVRAILCGGIRRTRMISTLRTLVLGRC